LFISDFRISNSKYKRTTPPFFPSYFCSLLGFFGWPKTIVAVFRSTNSFIPLVEVGKNRGGEANWEGATSLTWRLLPASRAVAGTSDTTRWGGKTEFSQAVANTEVFDFLKNLY